MKLLREKLFGLSDKLSESSSQEVNFDFIFISIGFVTDKGILNQNTVLIGLFSTYVQPCGSK